MGTRHTIGCAIAWLLLLGCEARAQPAPPNGEEEAAAETNPFADPELVETGNDVRFQIDPKVYRWSSGEPPVKMINQREGICFLTSIEGQLTAETDSVRVHLAKDGYWYLSGVAAAKDTKLAASAMAIRFVNTKAARPAAEAEPAKKTSQKSPSGPPEKSTAKDNRKTATGKPASPLELDGKRIEMQLPAPIERIAAGAGGKYLICYLARLGKLAIFDVDSSKVVKYITVGEKARFAAGRDKLVVVRSPQETVQRYELGGDFERELSVASPVEGPIADIIMGAASDGPILVRLGGDRLLAPYNGVELLDLQTLKRLDIDYGGNNVGMDGSLLGASADGSTFGFAHSSGSPSGLSTLTVQGKRATFRGLFDAFGYVMPSTDGKIVFTATGLYSSDLTPLEVGGRRDISFYPTLHPAYYVSVTAATKQGRERTPQTISIYNLRTSLQIA